MTSLSIGELPQAPDCRHYRVSSRHHPAYKSLHLSLCTPKAPDGEGGEGAVRTSLLLTDFQSLNKYIIIYLAPLKGI